METLVIEWQRSLPTRGAIPIVSVASAMRCSVKTPEEASRVFNALGAVLRALTTDDVPAPEGAQGNLDPRDE